MAEENGVAELISYKAVFLYAELLSKNEKYAEYSKVLTNNSGVNEFLALLKDAVVNKGTFLRSKTIIVSQKSQEVKLCMSFKKVNNTV